MHDSDLGVILPAGGKPALLSVTIVGRARGADMRTHARSAAGKRWEDLWFWVGICCLDSTWLMWCGMLSQDAWRCL